MKPDRNKKILKLKRQIILRKFLKKHKVKRINVTITAYKSLATDLFQDPVLVVTHTCKSECVSSYIKTLSTRMVPKQSCSSLTADKADILYRKGWGRDILWNFFVEKSKLVRKHHMAFLLLDWITWFVSQSSEIYGYIWSEYESER